DNNKDETLRLLQELLQTESYQRNNVNLFTYDFENNRYLHLSLREGLWYISKKLIEVEESMITAEDNDFRETKSFNLMVPKYLPRNQGNPLAMRVNVKFDAVNDM
ncbi:14678_t:CDS:2, partial [Rhizophagus irregularis]